MRLREFWEGATRPSGPALVGALAVGLLLPGLLALTLEPRHFVALDAARLGGPRPSNWDNVVHATRRVLELRAGPVRPHDVAIVGASSPVNALTSEAAMSAGLSARLDPAARVHDLSCIGLQTLDELALADAVAERVGGAVVLVTTHFKLHRHPPTAAELAQVPGLPLELPYLDVGLAALGAERPRRTGRFALDHRRALAPLLLNWVHSFVAPPRPPGRYVERFEPLQGNELTNAAARMGALVHRRLARPAHLELNLELLARLAKRLRDRGVVLVLLEGTWNPAFAEAIESPAVEHYRARMLGFAAEHGAHYWDLVGEADLTPTDFLDLGHLGTEGARKRFTAALLDRVAALLAERTPQ